MTHSRPKTKPDGGYCSKTPGGKEHGGGVVGRESVRGGNRPGFLRVVHICAVLHLAVVVDIMIDEKGGGGGGVFCGRLPWTGTIPPIGHASLSRPRIVCEPVSGTSDGRDLFNIFTIPYNETF